MDATSRWFDVRALSALPFLLIALSFLGFAEPAAAHPADEYLQHLQIDLAPDRIDLTIAIGGGVLSKQALIGKLDANGDGSCLQPRDLRLE